MATVCITPNLRVYEREGEEYLSFLLKVIGVLDAKGYQIILLGHELRIDTIKDDRFLCRILKEKYPSSIHIDEFLDAKQVKQIIGICDFVISSRFHALIASFSQMIPALAIGWSHKYIELLAEIGLPNNLLEIQSRPGDLGLDAILTRFVEDLDFQKRIIQRTIPTIISRSANMMDHVLRQLGEK